MPRKRKTQSGAPAQPIQQGPPGRPYGAGVELEEAQRATPAPQAPPPVSADDIRSRPPSPEAAMAIAQGHEMPPANPLTAPSRRPGEPVTSGLRIGPGVGPEALVNNRARARRADVLTALAADTRSPRLRRLAERARRSA